MSRMGPPGEGPLPDRLAPGLSALLEAFQYAQNTGHAVANFAVEIGRLEQLGLSSSELRWLICKNYVGHLVDVTRPNQTGRELRVVKALKFESHSCFVLTGCGACFAKSLLACPHQARSHANDALPSWDGERRVLRVGEHVVREFHARACSQERILAAFERQGWPTRIDDPLPAGSGVDRKVRLNKIVYRLNHGLIAPHINFVCDGTGTRVCWEFNGGQ